MKLIKEGTRYIAITEFAERSIPKSAGFRWNPADKVWWTSELEKALRIAESPDCEASPVLKGELNDALRGAEESLMASRATDAVVDIPSPDGLEYLPFQRAGIAYAIERPATLIGDEMGLGKTIQICGLINETKPGSVMIICPASLKVNWQRELEKWLVDDYTIGIASGKDLPDDDILIINYDILNKHRHILSQRNWDLGVADEAHYIKNPKAQRSKAVVELLQGAGRRVLLTGTPIVNRPKELFSLIQLLDPDRWNNFMRYAKRYCGAYQSRWGWDFSGATHLPELQESLRRTVMVRRLKVNVLTDLPPKQRQVIPIPVNGYATQINAEHDLEQHYSTLIAEAQIEADMADASDDPEAYKTAVAKLKDLTRIEFNRISKIRHDTALLKTAAVVNHVVELLDSVDKVVVMAHHHDVVNELEAGLAEFSPVTLTGNTPQPTRQQSVDRFQNDPECKVFIGSIQASGVGITLTASSTVVFAELGWTPAEMSQAEDRCHRIGQLDSVLVQHLVIDGSLDARIAQTLVSKQNVLDRALDIEGGHIDPLPQLGERENRKPVPELDMDRDHIDLIHEGLQILAGFDPDLASVENGIGFNRIDGQFGHDLASKPSLSPKQAFYGEKLIRKYHRQLPTKIVKVLNRKENTR